MAEIIKRIIFMVMTVLMICIFWDVIFGPGTASVVMITIIIFGCLAIGVIDIFTES